MPPRAARISAPARSACRPAPPRAAGPSLCPMARRSVAKALVNAAGPWVCKCSSVSSGKARRRAWCKGAHIVLPRLFAHGRGYLFQNADGRVVFAIPYERDFTLIGTTDRTMSATPPRWRRATRTPPISAPRSARYLKQPVDPGRCVWRYAGVRPLRDDGTSKAQEATRDYVLELSGTSPPCSPCSAARSPPIAGSPKPRSSDFAPPPVGADRHSPPGLDRPGTSTGQRIRSGHLRNAGSRSGARLPLPAGRPRAWPRARIRQRGVADAGPERHPPRISARRSAPA